VTEPPQKRRAVPLAWGQRRNEAAGDSRAPASRQRSRTAGVLTSALSRALEDSLREGVQTRAPSPQDRDLGPAASDFIITFDLCAINDEVRRLAPGDPDTGSWPLNLGGLAMECSTWNMIAPGGRDQAAGYRIQDSEWQIADFRIERRSRRPTPQRPSPGARYSTREMQSLP
jgi:hypothetical protein